MQKELDALSTKLAIRIIGVNGVGAESGNASVTAGRTLPWLQDTDAALVWKSWNVAYRDVIILDAKNHSVAVYNLTTYDLAMPENQAALKKLLVDTANAP